MGSAEVQSRPDVRIRCRLGGAAAEEKERAAFPSVRPGLRATGEWRGCVLRIWTGRCVYPMARDLGRYDAGEVTRQIYSIWGAFLGAVGGVRYKAVPAIREGLHATTTDYAVMG